MTEEVGGHGPLSVWRADRAAEDAPAPWCTSQALPSITSADQFPDNRAATGVFVTPHHDDVLETAGGRARIRLHRHNVADHFSADDAVAFFAQQPRFRHGALTHGTVSLVAPKIIATSYHVLPYISFGATYACFNYIGVPDPTVEVIGWRVMRTLAHGDQDRDWALLELAGTPPFRPLVLGDRPATEDVVYMLSHPLGAPKQVIWDAAVGATLSGRFYGSLDSLPGSSGSPVFRASDHEMVGILEGRHAAADAFRAYSCWQMTAAVAQLDQLKLFLQPGILRAMPDEELGPACDSE